MLGLMQSRTAALVSLHYGQSLWLGYLVLCWISKLYAMGARTGQEQELAFKLVLGCTIGTGLLSHSCLWLGVTCWAPARLRLMVYLDSTALGLSGCACYCCLAVLSRGTTLVLITNTSCLLLLLVCLVALHCCRPCR